VRFPVQITYFPDFDAESCLKIKGLDSQVYSTKPVVSRESQVRCRKSMISRGEVPLT
jgi:hypothetical protein